MGRRTSARGKRRGDGGDAITGIASTIHTRRRVETEELVAVVVVSFRFVRMELERGQDHGDHGERIIR